MSMYRFLELQVMREEEIKNFKDCVHCIFASLFLSLKESLVKLGKMFFISLQKLFSFSRKSKFRILDIQIS